MIVKRYFFDTNIFVGLLRHPKLSEFIIETFLKPKENNLLVSVTVIGELEALKERNHWGKRRTAEVRRWLRPFLVQSQESQAVIRAYARIEAYSQGKLIGYPLPKGLSARNMGKNDLWIAAVAHVYEATLVTTDRDFIHLDDVFLSLHLIDLTEFK